MTLYYVDTCIWLNLFKKEGDARKGKPYWEIARDFLHCVEGSHYDDIVYSGIVLRELDIKLEKKDYFLILEELQTFQRVEVSLEDKNKARKLEVKYNFSISYYDLVHLCITERIGAVLVTRDKQLLLIADAEGVFAIKPEEFTRN
ncbi:PIN domain-containing protein [Candidatus Woesearchaeota archaeon]|nr:PIN domain-containing protein [Candidatus Woesearchaeota archaeon]